MTTQKRFQELGEFYAAGFFEEEEGSFFIKFSRALRRYWENYRLPAYHGEPLYPCGAQWSTLMVRPDFSYTVQIRWSDLEEKDPDAAKALREAMPSFAYLIPKECTVGGGMYTHSYPHFKRIFREGLNGYEARILKMKDADLKKGLLDVLAGIRGYHARVLDLIRGFGEDTPLYRALQRVPFQPATSLYEAIVCWNFMYYLDGCDDIGRPDADLIEFYRGEEMTEVFRLFFQNVDANDGWSGTLGPDYNPLTLQCLNAVKGLRRPLLELRVTPDMPEEVWDAALESIRAGGGSPSLYNEEGYQTALERLFPRIPQEDRLCFAGGGCTETMLAGMSNVGSLDAGINLAWIFRNVMQTALPNAESFEQFYQDYLEECRRQMEVVFQKVSDCQKLRAEVRPHPMRTLLVDDCIEKEKDFNQGGARYYWSIVNLAGLINVTDSLSVIRQVVFTDRRMTGAEFLSRLEEGEDFLCLRHIPRHGTDHKEANAMIHRLSTDLCAVYEGKTPYLGGKFLPSSIQFTTYQRAGKNVGATPDGRPAGAPLCDSIGAIHGNDKNGITALLNSAAALCQDRMVGTPVLNVKLDANQTSKALKPLALGYFKQGGLQMQITCVSKEALLDAKSHPEKYPNLIVRIGGYSEYFSRLSPELQQTVIDRTLYGV